jgi:hypothetical protein
MDLEAAERQSGISRIVNATSQQEAELLTHFREQFERNETGYYERQKNAVETEIIRDVLARLPQFIEEFGGTPIRDLDQHNIHIIEESKLSGEQRNLIQGERGWYLAAHQAAFVVPDASRLRTAETIVHELMHFMQLHFSLARGWRTPRGGSYAYPSGRQGAVGSENWT